MKGFIELNDGETTKLINVSFIKEILTSDGGIYIKMQGDDHFMPFLNISYEGIKSMIESAQS